ncbi:alpha/beta fold hydrolase [Calothrix sp. 336/3]|uniref:alpha/beta fold hydrolase n=1 Tax=Calothrix sp. 336/3 TaxID=1337936 RepID=UPI0004E366E1|nr:hypothetical protein [Calothrix sp. 336/3]AKG23467.1 hypothetical protein IJ00_21255 [Calothrix sp. 336/3]
MPIYGADGINFQGVDGDRYWFEQPFEFTGIPDIDTPLSNFPVSVFLPSHRSPQETPLVIALQGMAAPYGWNAFIVPTLTQMGIAVALLETPFAGERSLVRTFSAMVSQELQPLIARNIYFDTQLLFKIFSCTARDISLVREFCGDRYHLTNPRVALFGMSMGVLFSGYAFTANGIGERLLGAIGHTNLQLFAKSWGGSLLPDIAASPLLRVMEPLVYKIKPELRTVIKIMQLTKNLKSPDEFGRICNPMHYINRVESHRRVRFLLGANDNLVNIRDARSCAADFPNGECYVVPGMGHGKIQWGPKFVDHVRYFLVTQLGDWQN